MEDGEENDFENRLILTHIQLNDWKKKKCKLDQIRRKKSIASLTFELIYFISNNRIIYE